MKKSTLPLVAALSASFLTACSPPDKVFNALIDMPDGSHYLVVDAAHPGTTKLVIKQNSFTNDHVAATDGTLGSQKCANFRVVDTVLQQDDKYHARYSEEGGSLITNGSISYGPALSMAPADLLALSDKVDTAPGYARKLEASETQRCVFVPAAP